MNETVPNEPGEVRADQIQTGTILPLAFDNPANDGLAEVLAAVPYTDSDGGHMVALLAKPLGGDGRPETCRFFADATLTLATEAEIVEHRNGDRRRELAAALVDLAERIERDRLPIPSYELSITGCLNSRADVDRWARHFGVSVEPGGTDGRIPAAQQKTDVTGGEYGLKLVVRVTGPREDEPIKTSTGDTSPSVAGAEVGAAPSGPEVPASGPDINADEHRHAGAWKGAEPGSCGVSCECGETYDGFDSLAAAGELLDRHIAREVPMVDCTADATQRIQAYYEETDGTYGAVYTCDAHRGEVMAALLDAGLRGRTQGRVSGEPCGHQVSHVILGAPVLPALMKTAAEGTGTDDTASADATATDPTGVDGRTSLPVRADAVPVAPAGEAGATGITPGPDVTVVREVHEVAPEDGFRVFIPGPGRVTPPMTYDPMPTCLYGPGPERNAFMEAYARGLDLTHAGWHWHGLDRMDAGLAHQAKARREAERDGADQ